MVAIGLPAGAFLKAPVLSTVIRMISIKGSYVGNRQDGVEAIEFFDRGLIKAPFKKAPLKDLPHIFELMGKLTALFQNVAIYILSDKQIRARQDCRSIRARNPGITSLLYMTVPVPVV